MNLLQMQTRKRLAIITTHPIQYNAPLFQLLAKRGIIDIKVFYTWGQEVLTTKFDAEFNRAVAWDVPLLNGYDHEFAENVAKDKGSHHFWGIQNRGLQQLITRWSPDALLIFGWSFVEHLRLLRWGKNRYPVLFRGDSILDDGKQQSRRRKRLRKTLLRWVYRHIDFALYTGQRNKEYFEYFGVGEHQLVYVPHVVNNQLFARDEVSREREAAAWRRQLGIRPNEVVYLFAGKLYEAKNTTLLLEAFLEAGLKNSHLIFCGSGPQEAELRTRAAGQGRVHFTGFQNQSRMPVVYRLADVVVLPSKNETWGLAVNEAMACARAVLVSRVCGCVPDLVHEGSTGSVFDPLSRPELVRRLQELAGRKMALQGMGLAGQRLIAGFSMEQAAGAIEELVCWLR